MPVIPFKAVCAGVLLASLIGCNTTPDALNSGLRDSGATIVSNASDTSIHLALQRDMGQAFPRYFAEMATEVHEGRVLIVGTTRTPEDRIRATRIAWNIRGVKDVVNELQIAEEQSGLAYLKDTRISNQLRFRLLTAVDVAENNFDFETVNSVVYILGIARDQDELDYVAELAATIAGVERVVSHALLADDPRRGKVIIPADV